MWSQSAEHSIANMGSRTAADLIIILIAVNSYVFVEYNREGSHVFHIPEEIYKCQVDLV